MRLTIISSDGAVYKDQVVRQLDLSGCNVPQEVHALQWYDIYGEIEFSSNPGEPKPPNQAISELPEWALNCVTAWDAFEPAPALPSENQPVVQEAQH